MWRDACIQPWGLLPTQNQGRPEADIILFQIPNYWPKEEHNFANIIVRNPAKTNEGINLIFACGALNLDVTANFEEDTAAMLDSLHELFQEHGDKVTATLVAERMESKLNRHTHTLV